MTSSAPGAIPRTSALVKFFCPSCAHSGPFLALTWAGGMYMIIY